MTKIFDGKKFANELGTSLKKEVTGLKKKGTTPKLVSFLVGEYISGKKYLSLKRQAAQDIGAKLLIRDFGKDARQEEIIAAIEDMNTEDDVHGVMIQLPLPDEFSEKERSQIISAIDAKKDVDGMREDSLFVAPIVKAVLFAVKSAGNIKTYEEETLFVVVGAEGFAGGKIYRSLEEMGFRTKGIDVQTEEKEKLIKKADVLISVTGRREILKEDMVKEGVVLIDCGAPYPEVEKGAKQKALFVTPVPGGIGPLTIEYLLENLVVATKEQL